MMAASSWDGCAGSDSPEPGVRVRWKLTRNCAMRPRTFLLNMGGLLALSGAAGAAFWQLGYPIVVVFFAVQAIVLAALATVYAIHAADGEYVELTREALKVTTMRGLTLREHYLAPSWTRLELRKSTAALVLCSGRERVEVGRHLTHRQKRAFMESFLKVSAELRREAS